MCFLFDSSEARLSNKYCTFGAKMFLSKFLAQIHNRSIKITGICFTLYASSTFLFVLGPRKRGESQNDGTISVLLFQNTEIDG